MPITKQLAVFCYSHKTAQMEETKKMKKTKRIRIIAALLAMILATGLFAADCQNEKAKKIVSSIDLVSGTYKTTYAKNEVINYSAMKLRLTYTDGTKSAELGSTEFTTNTIDTSVAAVYELIATYIDKNNEDKEHTVKKSITVKEDEIVEPPLGIRMFELPTSIITYQNNIKEKTNKELEFMNREKGYTVGTDNEFVFFPRMQVRDEDNEPIVLDTYAPIIRIYDITSEQITQDEGEQTKEAPPPDGQPILLEGNELDQFVSIVEDKGLYQFSPMAAGKSFRIELQLHEDDIDSTLLSSLKNKVLSLDINVIEGYNAYNAKDLSMFDNSETVSWWLSERDNVRWKEFKAAAGLPLIGVDRDDNIKALILHNDISLVKSDFPASFFHAVDGSLRDNWNLYSRLTPKGEEFSFLGNYFTVDASKVPLITIDEAWDHKVPREEEFITQNTNLFNLGGGENGGWYGEMGVNNVSDVSFLGNTPKTDDKPEYTGGMKMFQTLCGEANFDNIIARSFFTMFLPLSDDKNPSPFLISNSRCYDTFSQMFFLWDALDVNVEKCDLRNAGGPIFVLTDYENGGKYNDYFSNVKVDSESTVESWLNGNEIWFSIGKATTIVSQIAPIDRAFNTFGKSIMRYDSVSKTEQLNMIAVIKPEDLVSIPDYTMHGTFTMGDAVLADVADPYVAGFKASFAGVGATVPIFKTNTMLGYGAYIGEAIGMLNPDWASFTGLLAYSTLDPENPLLPMEVLLGLGLTDQQLLQSDYITAYYGDLAIVLGYFNN